MRKVSVKVFRYLQDEDYLKYSGRDCVQVMRDTDYMSDMEEQMKTIKSELLKEWFKSRLQWHSHDFGSYCELEDIHKEYIINVENADITYDEDDEYEDEPYIDLTAYNIFPDSEDWYDYYTITVLN